MSPASQHLDSQPARGLPRRDRRDQQTDRRTRRRPQSLVRPHQHPHAPPALRRRPQPLKIDRIETPATADHPANRLAKERLTERCISVALVRWSNHQAALQVEPQPRRRQRVKPRRFVDHHQHPPFPTHPTRQHQPQRPCPRPLRGRDQFHQRTAPQPPFGKEPIERIRPRRHVRPAPNTLGRLNFLNPPPERDELLRVRESHTRSLQEDRFIQIKL